jgi:hypothetical protein
MPISLALQPTPDLLARREDLADLRNTLADRELSLATLRADLKAFEARYLHHVGILYADLDDLEARIAEREVDLYDSDSARQRAAETRARANETHAAAYDQAHEPEEFDPPPTLKTLFRDVAKRIHPDFARDPEEQAHFTRLMARANAAYTHGDTQTLQRILDDHHEINGAYLGEGPTAELTRITRQIAHATRDLAALDLERTNLLAGELAQLQADANAAKQEGRDLLLELATTLREQIDEAQSRFDKIDRQIRAHGK